MQGSFFCVKQCNAVQASLSITGSTDAFTFILLPVLDRQGDPWAPSQLSSCKLIHSKLM